MNCEKHEHTYDWEYSTIQLYCLCVEKFAFWLVIYNNKKSIQLTIKNQQLNKTRS